jgi:hypothetical protein
MPDQKPAETLRQGDVSASIWRNETEEGKAFYNVTYQKRYQKDGETKYGGSFSAYDLDDLMRCTLDARRYIMGRLKIDREATGEAAA